MLDAFRLKPFDLEPVLASWTDAPKFDGNRKKDLPVDQWLEKIKAGCIERKVPEECWHKVAQHYMGPNARARLEELKAVVAQVNGGKYRWNWPKFKVAMESMGWDIDTKRTETIKVSKGGSWWRMKKKDTTIQEEPAPEPAPAYVAQPRAAGRPTPQRSGSIWSIASSSRGSEPLPPIPPAYCEEPASIEGVVETPKPTIKRALQRRATESFWPMKKKDEVEEITTADSKGKGVAKMPSDSDLAQTTVGAAKAPVRAPLKSATTDTVVVTATEAKAPAWLLEACNALEFITSEHPKAMSIISAILITAGSIPAIPAISAGAGGAVLASSAAHAIGAIAVGLGQALGTTVKNNQQQQREAPASISTR